MSERKGKGALEDWPEPGGPSLTSPLPPPTSSLRVALAALQHNSKKVLTFWTGRLTGVFSGREGVFSTVSYREDRAGIALGA